LFNCFLANVRCLQMSRSHDDAPIKINITCRKYIPAGWTCYWGKDNLI